MNGTNPEATTSSPQPTSSTGRGSKVIMTVLITWLCMVIAFIGFDRYVLRPRNEAEQKNKLEELKKKVEETEKKLKAVMPTISLKASMSATAAVTTQLQATFKKPIKLRQVAKSDFVLPSHLKALGNLNSETLKRLYWIMEEPVFKTTSSKEGVIGYTVFGYGWTPLAQKMGLANKRVTVIDQVLTHKGHPESKKGQPEPAPVIYTGIELVIKQAPDGNKYAMWRLTGTCAPHVDPRNLVNTFWVHWSRTGKKSSSGASIPAPRKTEEKKPAPKKPEKKEESSKAEIVAAKKSVEDSSRKLNLAKAATATAKKNYESCQIEFKKADASFVKAATANSLAAKSYKSARKSAEKKTAYAVWTKAYKARQTALKLRTASAEKHNALLEAWNKAKADEAKAQTNADETLKKLKKLTKASRPKAIEKKTDAKASPKKTSSKSS